ncbi:MAG TPA: DUF2851 family protein [Thermomicrobiales bacterium]|nr:DUF2851 family protein [Thermomicrobiales bacterium]
MDDRRVLVRAAGLRVADESAGIAGHPGASDTPSTRATAAGDTRASDRAAAGNGRDPVIGVGAASDERASLAEHAAASDRKTDLPSATVHLRAGHAPRVVGAADPGSTERLTEAQLTALWRGRRFPDGALVTRTGVPVTVVYQGRAGRGPGPDFRGAVIAGPSGLTLRGDVELHVRSSAFRAHGHATDPAYANIILHVVFEDDTGVDTPLPGGRTAPVVALAPWVAQRAGELERWLARPLLWREPCHDAVPRMGAHGAGAALDAEGERRFEAHGARLREIVARDGLEQALYEGLLGALGYGGNTPAMLALARLLPWRVLEARSGRREAGGARSSGAVGGRSRARIDGGQWTVERKLEAGRWRLERGAGATPEDERGTAITEARGAGANGRDTAGTTNARREAGTPGVQSPASSFQPDTSTRFELEALLLGSAGLLPSQRAHRGPVDTYVEGLDRAFGHARLASLPASAWKLWGVRPANAPARRVAAAAALLDALGAPSGLLRALDASTVNEAIAPLSARAGGYWLAHFDPCAGPCRLPPAFVGRARALEILLNVVLPAAAASGDDALAGRARALYAKLPRPAAYGATRFLENALGSEGVRVPVNARRAQGLLALHRDWCTQGGCGRCPLS